MTKAKRIDHQVIKQSFHIKFQNIRSREIADDDDDGGGEDKFMSPVEKSKKESDDADALDEVDHQSTHYTNQRSFYQ